jgi:hypothetical protein
MEEDEDVITPQPDPLADRMTSMLDVLGRFASLLAQHRWKGRRVTWRTSTITSVHSDIYNLIDTVRSTTHAVMVKGKPETTTRLSRRFVDNLTTTTLDGYLVDEQGMSTEPSVIMQELITAVRELVANINLCKESDAMNYEWYLAQCSNLFVELEIVFKAYL